ncbi:uracil-DNA glycosylase [Paraburkholderia sp. BL10I2N1]|uniref:uracil-DNA glycosylase n=1 Tax=Paraburkholderia sp. BL10I2N1 TaxID=1938796 RepID=UPI00105B5607|nr:uracil-DNA glycosylase [Paraburkholderia sp. BL10I2N1]TDN69660.1 DNA polymerase [Paraburkholderia sp. BL10I2N1]
MALHESALEELGLSPLWVRRGMGQPTAPVAEAAMAAAVPARQAASVAQESWRKPSRPATGRWPEPVAATVTDAAVQPAMRQATDRGESAIRLRDDTGSRDMPRPADKTGASEQPAPVPDPDDLAWFDDLSTGVPAEARENSVDAKVASIATLDWDALSARVASCERCRLCEKRTNTVFGVGDRNADWMLIGEAPGENEDRQGEPFVGQAGKLLDNMLRALTLARDTNVYIANVIKCRPPGNRNPEPDEVARCEPYLQRQVALVKPKLIVALGRFAAQSLLKTDASISSLRGRVHEYEGVPVIVTYHPAYLLRSLPDKAKAWADLCLARDTWRKAAGGPAS